MFGRRPRPTRRKIETEAWLSIEGSFAARRCTLLDISENGAKIAVSDPLFVPPQFQLRFSRGGPSRACKVRWRSGKCVGVQFV